MMIKKSMGMVKVWEVWETEKEEWFEPGDSDIVPGARGNSGAASENAKYAIQKVSDPVWEC